MLDGTLLPPHIALSEQDLQNTPPIILLLLEYLLREKMELKKQVEEHREQSEELKSRLNLNLSNSSRPSSTDSPYKSKETGKDKKKSAAKKGRKGHRQTLLTPTKTKIIQPEICSYGYTTFHDLTDYHTHQADRVSGNQDGCDAFCSVQGELLILCEMEEI